MKYIFAIVLPIILFDLIRRWYLIITQRKEFHLFVTPAFICCFSSIIVSAIIFYTKSERIASIFISINFIILDAMVYSVYHIFYGINKTINIIYNARITGNKLMNEIKNVIG